MEVIMKVDTGWYSVLASKWVLKNTVLANWHSVRSMVHCRHSQRNITSNCTHCLELELGARHRVVLFHNVGKGGGV